MLLDGLEERAKALEHELPRIALRQIAERCCRDLLESRFISRSTTASRSPCRVWKCA
jgi:hypothetical protein